ncbi:Eco57I restriction-modification methylase domain-containing protein [Fimbriiglobus ruber]|uniref:site-specific DNA-methyltransferase (adenine-specific) n=1 Tax=Fimbriiglobus ruber TaxID=1908690 RepID=A0A225D430_9BACT|nr:Eco57I restriction-modification methylase domain-containing protein [Fimbriiglobus ruber]OWK36340.1 Modification methylase PstI [Fimbriiglobus ruber]
MGLDLLDRVDFLRLDANQKLQKSRNTDWGQFLTPAPVARMLAALIVNRRREVRILDAGAGSGSLFAAAVGELCQRTHKPNSIYVSAYEIDPALAAYLPDTFAFCDAACRAAGVAFLSQSFEGDFLAAVSPHLTDGLVASDDFPLFDLAILNPPYKKINAESHARHMLAGMGIETTNLYTGFMAVVVRLLAPGGELVAITPRSFCNGSYFRSFRKSFLTEMRLRTLHVFESRHRAFREDDVLQENVILHATKGGSRGKVCIVSSSGPEDELPLARQVKYAEVVRPDDPQAFIHIAADDLGNRVAASLAGFQASLQDLGLTVSTGRVVDFRAKDYLRQNPEKGTVPLIWPTHFDRGYIAWPKIGSKKPEAILNDVSVRSQLLPNENYVLVRRFSSKEEKRRVVAAVYEASRIPSDAVGFENHLNYFHHGGRGFDLPLAKGLAIFLNSTLVDVYLRQFNGHTQVNATDLRSLRYPSVEQLRRLGDNVSNMFPAQSEVDTLLSKELNMPDDQGIDSVKVKKKVVRGSSGRVR